MGDPVKPGDVDYKAAAETMAAALDLFFLREPSGTIGDTGVKAMVDHSPDLSLMGAQYALLRSGVDPVSMNTVQRAIDRINDLRQSTKEARKLGKGE